MALTLIEQVRLLVQDNAGPGLYILSDAEIEFLLEKNTNNLTRTSLEAARIILFNLSMRGDSTVDILSIRGSRAAEQYRLALQMFIRDPNLNPVIQNCGAWAGGISNSEMLENNLATDNNYVGSMLYGNRTEVKQDYFSF